MPDLAVRLHDLPLPNPGICALTGEPTTELVTLEATRDPGWTWLFRYLGIVGAVILRVFVRSQTVTVQVPQRSVGRGVRRVAITGMLVLLPFLIVMFPAVLLNPAPVFVALFLACVAAFIGLAVVAVQNHRVHFVWVARDMFMLRGVHQRFITALHDGTQWVEQQNESAHTP